MQTIKLYGTPSEIKFALANMLLAEKLDSFIESFKKRNEAFEKIKNISENLKEFNSKVMNYKPKNI